MYILFSFLSSDREHIIFVIGTTFDLKIRNTGNSDNNKKTETSYFEIANTTDSSFISIMKVSSSCSFLNLLI